MNYCLAEYDPAAPLIGKYRSSNLLFNSFDVTQASERVYRLVEIIRNVYGESNTVWGAKWDGNQLYWEFYFYDYRRRLRERSISLLLEAIKPLVSCPVEINEKLHYFMFSIDVTRDFFAESAELSEIHLYMGNVLSRGGSGICYSWTDSGKRLENFYFFLDAHRERDSIIAKICYSAVVDIEPADVSTILWPELVECRTICVANKQQNDCVYFSGITVNQLLYFLKRLNYPSTLITYVEQHREQYDYLLFDVGYDYRMEGDKLLILKSGYYGIF